MNGLSLCAGIGGIDLGLHLVLPHYRTICYVEKEAYCQEVLCARMADGLLDRGALWDDVTTFSAHEWKGLVDIVHGGYPCQPFSVAGRRKGAADARHLWPDIARILAELEPEWCFFENVAGHLTLGFDVVAQELEAMGYRVAAGLFTAAEVGAPHRRQRLFILAHAGQLSKRRPAGREETEGGRTFDQSSGSKVMGYPDDPRLEGRREPEREGPDEWAAWPPGPKERDRWAAVLDRTPGVEPAIRRVVDGLPHRVDRLKALGNAVVPDVAALAWRTLHAELTNGH